MEAKQIAGSTVWAAPVVLAGVGYLLPSLHAPVKWAIWSSLPEAGPLSGMIIACVLWVVMELWVCQNRNTTATALQVDDFLSKLLAFIFFGASIWFASKGSLEWWLFIPTVASLVDAFLTGATAINNAAQKPYGSGKANT